MLGFQPEGISPSFRCDDFANAETMHLTPCVLARNLRQSLKNKELLPNHAKMTGEPNG